MYHCTVDINKQPSPYTTKQPVCLGRSRTRASGQVKVLAPAIRALKDRFREKKRTVLYSSLFLPKTHCKNAPALQTIKPLINDVLLKAF